jgi:ComF family protein
MKLPVIANSIAGAALSLLYPQPCAVCGKLVENLSDGSSCAACWRATRLFDGTESICGKCGALWPVALVEKYRAAARCGLCRDEPFTIARAGGVYEGALRASVLRLKREPHLPSRLADSLLAASRRLPPAWSRIVPVPLHDERQRERGFNQASVIGQALARATGAMFDEWSLARTILTPASRAGMDAAARRESVADAFAVTRPRLIEKQSILLVDDVFTTGATAAACAAALLAAGATQVSVLTLARASHD